MNINWTEILVALITFVVAPCVIALTKVLFTYLKTKTADARMMSVLTDVAASIDTSFSVWQGAFTAAKTKLSADGIFDNTDLEMAIKEAAEAAAGTLTVSTVSFLQTNGINLQAYLIDKIRARMEE